jgi:uncharacterized protein
MRVDYKFHLVMEWIWITLGVLLTIAGLAGSVLPVLPGPPLNYIALLILHFTRISEFSDRFLISWLIITLVVLALDYIIPIYGAKLTGGSKKGIWGATIGLVIGIFFFPPFGMILWPFIGAVIGEMIAGKDLSLAIKAGTGTFIGFIAGTVVKLVVSVVMTYYFFTAIF